MPGGEVAAGRQGRTSKLENTSQRWSRSNMRPRAGAQHCRGSAPAQRAVALSLPLRLLGPVAPRLDHAEQHPSRVPTAPRPGTCGGMLSSQRRALARAVVTRPVPGRAAPGRPRAGPMPAHCAGRPRRRRGVDARDVCARHGPGQPQSTTPLRNTQAESD